MTAADMQTAAAAKPTPAAAGEPGPGDCQRWTSRQPSWQHTNAPFQPDRYQVQPIPEAAAKQFVIANHYAGTMPAAIHTYGLLDHQADDRLVGVAVLSVPVQTRTLTTVFPTLRPFRESVELGRFVLLDDIPGNAETWMLARVFRHLAAQGVRGVVSFADPVPRQTATGATILPGHWGCIYQAASDGSSYTGRGTPRTLTLLPDGTVLNARTAQKIRAQEQGHAYAEHLLTRLGARPLTPADQPAAWLDRELGRIGARRLRHPGPHRYAFRIGTARQQRNTPIAIPTGLPHPKHIDHITSRPWAGKEAS